MMAFHLLLGVVWWRMGDKRCRNEGTRIWGRASEEPVQILS